MQEMPITVAPMTPIDPALRPFADIPPVVGASWAGVVVMVSSFAWSWGQQ